MLRVGLCHNRAMEERIARVRTLYIMLLAVAVLLGCVVRAVPGHWAASNPYADLGVGYDVSWPNCGATPPTDSSWGAVGITGGLSLRPNKCVQLEASWFRMVSLYVNTGYPGADRAVSFSHSPKSCLPYDAPCLAYDYGYAEGIYALRLATNQGVHASMWWLDIEIDNSWDFSPLVNRASIQGTVDAIKHEAVIAQVGIYSYPGQWNRITNEWRPGLPAWVATGSDDISVATAACSAPSFTGGPLWLAQYTQGLDHDVVCPTPY
jgi:hypothetical protein